MGFWSRLFGERETAEQKLARARGHLDDGEPRLALATVEPLDGPEADEIRHRGRALAALLDREAELRENPRSLPPDPVDQVRATNAPPEDDPQRGDAYRDAPTEQKK